MRKRVVELAKDVTGKDPFSDNAITNVDRAMNPAGSNFQQLTAMDVDYALLQAEIKSHEAGDAVTDERNKSSGLLDLEVDKEVENRPEIRGMLTLIGKQQLQMNEYRDAAARWKKNPDWDTDPNYIAMAAELEQRQKELKELRTQVRDAVLAEQRNKREIERQQQLGKLKHQLSLIKTKRDLLSERFARSGQRDASRGRKERGP